MCYALIISVLLVGFVFIFLTSLLSYTFFNFNNFKGSPFECGFQPFFMAGVSFSVPFFVISLMFLLFDVEILLLCFYPFTYTFLYSWGVTWGLLFFVLAATCYEWLKGVLSWLY